MELLRLRPGILELDQALPGVARHAGAVTGVRGATVTVSTPGHDTTRGMH